MSATVSPPPGVSAIKAAVRATYDQEARVYATRTRLQSANLTRLVGYLQQVAGISGPRAVLDVGCGTGIAVEALRPLGLIGQPPGSYLGIDLSPAMIAIARETLAAPGIVFEVADAESLPAASGSQDLVISNSVLHWLNQPSRGLDPSRAVAEIARVLKPGARAALSIAATGTGTRFRSAYLAVMQRQHGQPWFDAAAFLDNPIGLMQLHEVVHMLERAGLEIERAQLDYEPRFYATPAEYAADVRAYGISVFMAPIAAEHRERVWSEVVAEFESAAGAQRPYRHDQYMAYAIAQRPA